jgi:GTP cyclohydrolase I
MGESCCRSQGPSEVRASGLPMTVIATEEEALRAQALDGVRALLRLCGDDPDRDGLADTPRRVVDAMVGICTVAQPDPEALMGRVFDADGEADQMITVGPIRFQTVCEHHLMPFTGQAWIAYLPSGPKVVGLSKFARLVSYYASRLQVQERLTHQIADAIEKYAPVAGCAVKLVGEHACMSARGALQADSKMVTSDLRGPFRDDAQVRTEFLGFAAL